ncbi:MAG: hypothetical protein Q8J68_13655 [Methanolobus sp.]|uniref:hypothetical protein n=1 Tax=Methanolobus sp. TaxID=1874737 RepID=UPI00272F2731|nr:hypothetical protein [Methanolobus sp.]MDP2218320.1 hypothetical protein [Methanolobus sp.]
MSLNNRKGIDRQLLVALGLACVLIFFAIYYAENREVNDARTLAGRTLSASGDVKSYQFDIHSNISMMGEYFTLIRGNGSVDYLNEKMAVRLGSVDDSMDMIIVEGKAYFRSVGHSWEMRELNRNIWENYDQLTNMNLLLANSTNLSMEKTDAYFILTAFPDRNAFIGEAENAGLQLKGNERLNEYSIKYTIEKDSYRISSIESRIEFIMNVQGLMTPVAINNRVDIYDYDVKLEIETPVI